MKRNQTLTHTLALAVMMASNAWAALPAPMPKFMDANELADWRAEMAEQSAAKEAAQAKADALAADQSFYTGKPYLPATGSYAFKYRSYQPELARWTSEDPSGFPDGANANIYAPTPTSEFDWMGLQSVNVFGQSFDFGSFTDTLSSLVQNPKSLSMTVPVTTVTNSTQDNITVTYSGTGQFDAAAKVAGAGIGGQVNTGVNIEVTVRPGYTAELVVHWQLSAIPNPLTGFLTFTKFEPKTYE
jgi:RHS repeat-associated protein